MVRYRSSQKLRPIHRVKHVIDVEGAISDTQSVTDLISTVDSPVITSTNQVETGAHVYGIYLKIECNRTSGTGRSNTYFALFKNPGANLSLPQADNVGGQDEKRYVLHQSMVMLGDFLENMPRVLFDGVIKIPRGFARMGPKDKLQVLLTMGGNSVTADFCLQCHYKEFK